MIQILSRPDGRSIRCVVVKVNITILTIALTPPQVKVQNASNAALEQEVRALSAEREAAKEDADRAKKWSEHALLQMTNSDQELIDCKDLLQIARQNAMKVLGTLEEDRRILVELRQKAHAIKNHVQVFYVGESLDGQGGEVGGAGGGGRTGSGGIV